MSGNTTIPTFSLGSYEPSVDRSLDKWREIDGTRRLWNKDAGLWTESDESRWLGWLDVVDEELSRVDELSKLGQDVAATGFENAVVLGMGGSSLCPDVLRRSFTSRPGYPRLHVLDSTVPEQVAALESSVDPERTLFIVASKSGTTAEPNAFEKYFFEKAGSGERFLAITDPGSALERLARDNAFRGVLYGEPSIGGRFSALSKFGLGPAAVMGLDVRDFLTRASAMVEASREPSPERNPAVSLGVVLGTLAREGRDKLTLVTSPEVESLGSWLEQLIAESTGKIGKGIVPVDGEALAAPEAYGNDRVFVCVGEAPAARIEQLESLERAGHPVVRIPLESPRDLAPEFFRWEIATAVAGAVMELNPFDQPDVEASKVATRTLTARFEETGELPHEEPDWSGDGLVLFTDARNREALGLEKSASPGDVLRAHLDRLVPGDYFALNAFLGMNDENAAELQAIRHSVRDRKRVATTLGFGPRFLHSTGQLHKGGPNRGVFLHLTADDARDLPIPGQKYTFGNMKTFQAAGDLEVLLSRGRRALRVHLGTDVPEGLRTLRRLVSKG